MPRTAEVVAGVVRMARCVHSPVAYRQKKDHQEFNHRFVLLNNTMGAFERKRYQIKAGFRLSFRIYLPGSIRT